jgi:ribulose-phosphate 3-epimerase
MNLQTTVYPGMVAHSIEEFNSRVEEVKGFADGVHVDVADGVYVPNITVDLNDLNLVPNLPFEAHLMVQKPFNYFELCKEKGFCRVLVHIDTLQDSSYEGALDVQSYVHELGMEFGLVFKRDMKILHDEKVARFDRIMIMTIDVGFSGLEFAGEQVDVVRDLHEFDENVLIQVDGHVDETTAPVLVEAGARVLVSTSYLSGENIKEKYLRLKELKG